MTIISSSQQSFGAKGEIDDLLSELAQLWPGGPSTAPASQDDKNTQQNQVLPTPTAAGCVSTEPPVQNDALSSPIPEYAGAAQDPRVDPPASTTINAPQATPEYMVHVTTATKNDGSADMFAAKPSFGNTPASNSQSPGVPQVPSEEAQNPLLDSPSQDDLSQRLNGVRQNPWGSEPGNEAYGKVANGVPLNHGSRLSDAVMANPWAAAEVPTANSVQSNLSHQSTNIVYNPWGPFPDETAEAVVASAPKKTQSKRERLRYNPWDLSPDETDGEVANNLSHPSDNLSSNPWVAERAPVRSNGVQNGALRNLKLPVVNGSPLRNPPPVLDGGAPSMMPPMSSVPALENGVEPSMISPISNFPAVQNGPAPLIMPEVDMNMQPVSNVADSQNGVAPSAVQSDFIGPEVQYVRRMLLDPDCPEKNGNPFPPDFVPDTEVEVYHGDQKWRLSQGQNVQWNVAEGHLDEWPVRPDPDGQRDRKGPVEQSQQPRQQQIPSRMLQSTRGEEIAVYRKAVTGSGSMVSSSGAIAESEDNQEAVMELLRGLPDSVLLTEPLTESLESMLQTERLSPSLPMPTTPVVELSLQEKLDAELMGPANVETVKGTLSQEFTLCEMPGDVGKWLSELAEEIPVQDYPLLSFLPEPQPTQAVASSSVPVTTGTQPPSIVPVTAASQTLPVVPSTEGTQAPSVVLVADTQAPSIVTAAAGMQAPSVVPETTGTQASLEEIPFSAQAPDSTPGLAPSSLDGSEVAVQPTCAPLVVPTVHAESCSLPTPQRDFTPSTGIKLSHYDGFADADYAESNYGPSDNRLGQLMVEMGLISAEQLEHCVSVATELSLPLGRVFIMSGWINGRQLQWSIQLQAFLKDGLINVDTCRAVADLMTCSGMTLKRALNCAGYSDAYGFIERRATRLGDFLIESGIVKAERYYEVLYKSQALGIPVGRLLVINGLISTQLLECAINTQRFVREGRVSRQDAVVLLQRTAERHAEQTNRSTRRDGTPPVPLKTIRLGELLSLSGIASEAQIEHALEIGLVSNLPIGRVLVDLQLVSGYTLEMALNLQSLVSRDAIEPLDAAYALIDIHYHNLTLTEALEKNRSLSERRTLTFEQFITSLELISKEQIKEAVEISCQSPLFVSKALVFSGALAESTVQVALLCHFYVRESMLTPEEAMLLFNHCHKTGLSVDEAVAELSLQLRTLA